MKKILSMPVIVSLLAPMLGLFLPLTTHAAINFNNTLTLLNVDSGLVGHWTLDGKDMTRNIADTSGTGNTGYMAAAATSSQVRPGPLGQALNFDGTSQYIDVANNATMQITGTITLSAWYYHRDQITTGDIMGKTQTNFVYEMIAKSGIPAVSFSTWQVIMTIGGNLVNLGYQLTNQNDPYKNKWVHMVSVYDGSNVRIYLNGVQVASTPASGSILTTSDSFNIGARGGSNAAGKFNSPIDDVRVYNRALSQTEIAFLYMQGGGSKLNTTISSPDLNSGLVGYWTFDGKNMISNAADSSGYGNKGSLISYTSTTTVPGVIGQALAFNGTTQYVNVAHNSSLSLSNGGTFSAWIYPTSNTSYKIILAKRNSCGGGQSNYELYTNGGDLRFYSNAEFSSGYTVKLRKWQHVTAVAIGTTKVQFYVDGNFVKEVTIGSMPTNSAAFQIGNDGGCGSAFFAGSIDDVRVYNRPLSQTEIQQLYNQGAGTHQNTTVNPPNLNLGLVGHWTFDGKDIITNVADSSSNGNKGYLRNFTSTTTAAGAIGQAIRFDGVNDYIDFGTPAALTAPWAFSVWVNRQGNTQLAPILSDYAGSNWEIELEQWNNTHKVGITRYGVSNYASNYTAPIGQWVHLVFVADGTNTYQYVNGVLNYTYSGITASLPRYWMGANRDIGYYLNGYLDDARIYNRTISTTEIQQLYNLGH